MGSKSRVATLALVASVFTGTARVQAQGCSQCRDTVSQTNPGVQQSYRDAIGVMLASVFVLGGAGVWAIRRFR